MPEVQTCSICLDTIEKQIKAVTSCNHHFHQECCETWLIHHHRCSLCRQHVNWFDIFHQAESDHNAPWVFQDRIEMEHISQSEESSETEESLTGLNSDSSSSSSDYADTCFKCKEEGEDSEMVECYECIHTIHPGCMDEEEKRAHEKNSSWICASCKEDNLEGQLSDN